MTWLFLWLRQKKFKCLKKNKLRIHARAARVIVITPLKSRAPIRQFECRGEFDTKPVKRWGLGF